MRIWKDKKELGYKGEYVCHHCHLVYCVHGSQYRCDVCNRTLKWADAPKVKELLGKWGDKQGADMVMSLLANHPNQ